MMVILFSYDCGVFVLELYMFDVRCVYGFVYVCMICMCSFFACAILLRRFSVCLFLSVGWLLYDLRVCVCCWSCVCMCDHDLHCFCFRWCM